MAKVPKHKRIKRATVLIKRSRCVRNTKAKSHSPLYQKLKVNNHSLARALSQEKQESQLLFSRNVELIAEVQDLVHACNNRDRVISNILKNAKDMMQMLVTMSGFLTNTISSCQEYVSNQINTHRASTSSAGKRDSTKRLSTKSPARGVVKPMVSGYTITKPTINLSRVNMQRVQNQNLSIIQEGPATPERNIERSSENRRSRTRATLPERIPVSAIRDEGSDDEEHIMINRRTSRFSQGRLSSGRYSKRNSGRLSGGGGIAGRLSKRSSDHSELIKSPRVTLQDVSRYLTNNQTVNVRLLSETTNGNQTHNGTSIEDTQVSEAMFSPEYPAEPTIIPETQVSQETTTNSSDSDESENNTVRSRRQNSIVNNSTKLDKRTSSKKKSSSSRNLESQIVDALEGTSWMYDSEAMETDDTPHNNAVSTNDIENDHRDQREEEEREQESSPVSSLSAEQRRRSSNYFRTSELSKFGKSASSRLNVFDNHGSPNASVASTSNAMDPTSSFLNRDDEDENDDDDDAEEQRVNALRFITQRRGLSGRMPSNHSSSSSRRNIGLLQDDEDDDDDDDDETLMLNMQRQLRHQQTPRQPSEQPERLQFDMNELLQLTPLKPLLNMNLRTNNGPVIQVDIEPEPTATIQLTQKIQRPADGTETFCGMPTLKINHQNGLSDLAAVATVRGHDPNKRLSEMSTTRLSTRIELPRITDIMNITEENHQETQMILTPENNKQQEKRKRMVSKPAEETAMQSESEIEEEVSVQRKKKPRQPKKKSNKDKDPSSAKVVLQKLNDSSPQSNDRKNPEESISSARSSMLSRADQSSDSESSTASYNSRQIPSRPRRQKAPKNLKEQGLRKKLRRDQN